MPDGEIFFVTICAKDRALRPFAQVRVAQALLASARHYHEAGNWWLRLFLIMPDHIHALMVFPPTKRMRKVVAAWKSYTAKTTGISWQQDFFDHRVRNPSAFYEKELYILNNPVRQGLAKNTEEWPWKFRQQDLTRTK